MEQKIDLAIILPLYNPHKNWDKELFISIKKIQNIFDIYNLKIIIVNDGSSVDVSKEIRHLLLSFNCLEYHELPINKGKGCAIRTGLQSIFAEYYIYTDWDFPFGETVLLDFYHKLTTEKFDIILGKRTSQYYKLLPLERRIISNILRVVSFLLFFFKSYDTQAGLKGINNSAKDLFLKTKLNSFIFELEFIKHALKNKLQLSNIEVNPKSTIIFTNFSLKTIIKEVKSFIKLLIRE